MYGDSRVAPTVLGRHLVAAGGVAGEVEAREGGVGGGLPPAHGGGRDVTGAPRR